jgi:hypothetical protein
MFIYERFRSFILAQFRRLAADARGADCDFALFAKPGGVT